MDCLDAGDLIGWSVNMSGRLGKHGGNRRSLRLLAPNRGSQSRTTLLERRCMLANPLPPNHGPIPNARPPAEKLSRATHHLFGSHAHCLDGELASTHVEEVLEVGPEEVDHEHVVEALLAEVVHLRDTDCGQELLSHSK